jgi:hypothetical protein
MAHNSQNVTPHHLTQDCVCLHHYCFQRTTQNQLHRKLKNHWSQWHPHATWRTRQYYVKNSSAARVGLIGITWRTHQQYLYTYYSPALYEELVSSIDGTHQHYVKNLSAVQVVLISTYKNSSVHMLLISTIKSPPPYFCYSLLSTLALIPTIHHHKHQLQLCFNVQQIVCPWNF